MVSYYGIIILPAVCYIILPLSHAVWPHRRASHPAFRGIL